MAQDRHRFTAIYRMVSCPMTLTEPSGSWRFSTWNNLKEQDRAILTMTEQYEVLYDLANGAIFNDLEWT